MERIKLDNYILDDEVKEYRKKLYYEIKNNKDIMSYLTTIGIIDDEIIKSNLSNISYYKEDNDYCKNCPGFNNCNKSYPHYQIKLTFNGTFMDKKLVPCKLKLDDEEKDKMYVIRDFPSSWRLASILEMDKSAVRKRVIERYVEVQENKYNWIFITGINRSGKSYIAASLLNSLISKFNRKAIFINYPIRVRDLQDMSFTNKEEFVKTVNLYSSIPLLVIDDFGNEYKNEYIRDTITLAILQERARLGLITIFTSELNYDDIESMYSITNAGKARGKQIRRLLESFAGDAIDVSTAAIY